METILHTPRPSAHGDYSGKPTLTSANFGALASIMVPSESFPISALVTPTNFIAQQEVCYTGVHQAGTATQKKQLSLIVSRAVSALTSNDDMPSPRREQPAFTPRPGKDTTLFSKNLILSFYILFLTLVCCHFSASENRSI